MSLYDHKLDRCFWTWLLSWLQRCHICEWSLLSWLELQKSMFFFFFFSSSVSPFILLCVFAASMKRGEELRTCILLLLLLRHTLQNCFCVSFFYSLFKHSGGCGEWPMEKPLNAQRHASEFACCCVMWFNYATKWHTEKHTDMSSAEIII